MAYVEMRMIMVKMLWNFDYELCDESDNWLDQKVYLVWKKEPLMVQLRPRKDVKEPSSDIFLQLQHNS